MYIYIYVFFRPTLKHQRPQDERQRQYSSMNDWYKRGQTAGSTSTINEVSLRSSHLFKPFRKGACENCGSMTHKKKDCVEV